MENVTKQELLAWLTEFVIAHKLLCEKAVLNGKTMYYTAMGPDISLQQTREIARICDIQTKEYAWSNRNATADYISFSFNEYTFYELENYKEN